MLNYIGLKHSSSANVFGYELVLDIERRDLDDGISKTSY